MHVPILLTPPHAREDRCRSQTKDPRRPDAFQHRPYSTSRACSALSREFPDRAVQISCLEKLNNPWPYSYPLEQKSWAVIERPLFRRLGLVCTDHTHLAACRKSRREWRML